jgi:hypothetical protein
MSFEKKSRGEGGKYSTSNGENSPQNKRWMVGIYNLKTEMYKRKRERRGVCSGVLQKERKWRFVQCGGNEGKRWFCTNESGVL